MTEWKRGFLEDTQTDESNKHSPTDTMLQPLSKSSKMQCQNDLYVNCSLTCFELLKLLF